jgi:hypothetical protein
VIDDENTYGFSKADAEDLLSVTGNKDVSYPTNAGRMTPCLYGRTKSGGLNVGTPALVDVYDESGALVRELLAETRVSNIAGTTEIVLFSAYSRWLALRLC